MTNNADDITVTSPGSKQNLTDSKSAPFNKTWSLNQRRRLWWRQTFVSVCVISTLTMELFRPNESLLTSAPCLVVVVSWTQSVNRVTLSGAGQTEETRVVTWERQTCWTWDHVIRFGVVRCFLVVYYIKGWSPWKLQLSMKQANFINIIHFCCCRGCFLSMLWNQHCYRHTVWI